MTASRDQHLAQLKRQIEQADFQCKSYARTLTRAETNGDTPRVTEYDQRLADATVAVRTLRMEWLQIKIEQCAWKAGRNKSPDDRCDASEASQDSRTHEGAMIAVCGRVTRSAPLDNRCRLRYTKPMTDTTDITDNIDEWTTTETLAQEYHVSSRTIRRLCACGDVPAVSIGRQWRIRRADWEQYLVDWRVARQQKRKT